MTRDELADYFKTGIDALHAHVDELPDGPAKARYNRRAMLVHALLDGLKGDAVDDGLVQPMSGGGPKP
ncbi:MAG: hypothetical protein JSS57_21460 [Proteobacteria bacterium]|nr:hypothetical protein [Pseudomonadota bacterium]